MIPDLPLGGAEILFVRLAKALSERHHVHVFLGSRTATHPDVVARLDGIKVSSPPLSTPVAYRLFYKFALLCARPESRFHLADLNRSWALRRLHKKFHFDVVNPHLVGAERQACLAFQNVPIPIVGSDHGDYHWVFENPEWYEQNKIVLQRADGLICPSSANVASARRYPRKNGFSYFTIFYGLERAHAAPWPSKGESAGEPFRFVMVARGQEEKGWTEAIEAFRMLSQDRPARPVELHLVGSGRHLDKLRDDPGIRAMHGLVFHGYQSDPSAIVNTAHVGLLPSYLPSESLPVSIIEFLAAGKPVIATPVGGIVEMLESNSGCAGVIVPRTPAGRADVPALARAMESLLTDRDLLRTLEDRTGPAFSKFSMETCVDRYEEAFRSFLS